MNDLIFTVTLEGFLVVIDNPTGNIVRVTDVFDQFKMKKRKKIKPVGLQLVKKIFFYQPIIYPFHYRYSYRKNKIHIKD